MLAKNKDVVSRSDLSSNEYSDKDPRLVTINEVAANGDTPVAINFQQAFNAPEQPVADARAQRGARRRRHPSTPTTTRSPRCSRSSPARTGRRADVHAARRHRPAPTRKAPHMTATLPAAGAPTPATPPAAAPRPAGVAEPPRRDHRLALRRCRPRSSCSSSSSLPLLLVLQMSGSDWPLLGGNQGWNFPENYQDAVSQPVLLGLDRVHPEVHDPHHDHPARAGPRARAARAGVDALEGRCCAPRSSCRAPSAWPPPRCSSTCSTRRSPARSPT